MPDVTGEPVLISSLNQLAFCARRFGLMFVDGLWQENEHTVLGTLLHENADEPSIETDSGVTTITSLPIFSDAHGLMGRADVVEVIAGRHFPVEYKKGRRKSFDNDDIQLCAQALCLEEMFNEVIVEGSIYHATSRKRRKVIIDDALREKTIAMIDQARNILETGLVAPAVFHSWCEECSLFQLCMPEITEKNSIGSVLKYQKQIWETKAD